MKNILQCIIKSFALIITFILIFTFSIAPLSYAQFDEFGEPLSSPSTPPTPGTLPGEDNAADTGTGGGGSSDSSSGSSDTTLGGGGSANTPRQGVNSGKVDRDLQCYTQGVGGSKDNTGVVLEDGSVVNKENLGRCKESMPVYPDASKKQKEAGEKALAAQKAAAIDPCSGVGSWYILGGDRVACEIWLFLSKFILQVSAQLAKLSSDLFDYTTQKFVLQISTMFKDSDGEDKAYIYGGWSVIRDLANIIAFFGAMYTGFRYITGSDGLDFKKAVTKLVLYLLMVNFSFPIAKFLIDISNVLSLQIYGGITDYTAGASKLSSNILATMNLNSLVSQVGVADPAFKGFSSFSLMWLAIIYLFATFAVFLYASLMILVRSFILLACVILSPLMFLNFAFPSITSLHEKWRENFFGQILFAPILMFGFWLSFILLQTATINPDELKQIPNSSSVSSGREYTSESECKKSCTDGGSCAKVADIAATMFTCTAPTASSASTTTTISGNSTYSNVGALINMLLAILSLFLTVKIAAAASGGVGKTVSGFVGGAMKTVGLGVTTGGLGLLGAHTFGRMGSAMANSSFVKNTGAENSATRRLAASLASRAGNGMSSMSIAGTKSYEDRKYAGAAKQKELLRSENKMKIRNTGMTDLIEQAKTKDEVKKATEEMEMRANDKNYKWNNDLHGRDAEKKTFQDNQTDRKEAKEVKVANKNFPTFFQAKNSLRKTESGGELLKTREDRLQLIKEGRENKLASAEGIDNDSEAFKKKEVSENKSEVFVQNIASQKIKTEAENKIEAMKGTNVYHAPAYAAGKAIGTIKADVKEGVVTMTKPVLDVFRSKKMKN